MVGAYGAVFGAENLYHFAIVDLERERADSPGNLGFHERRLVRARERLAAAKVADSPEARAWAGEIRARELLKADLRGRYVLTLPTLTGIGMGWWVLVFVGFLAFAGWGMGRLEQRFAGLRPRA